MRPLLVVVVLLLSLHVALGVLVHRHPEPGIDRWAFDVLDEIRTPTGVDVVRKVTYLGALPVVAIVVALGALYAYRTDRAATGLALIVAFLLTVALVTLTKTLWDRPRPDDLLARVSSQSYPSGHSAYAVMWIAAAALTRRRAVIAAAAVVAIAIGLSRLYLHVHYLTDVMGGAALSAAILIIALRRV